MDWKAAVDALRDRGRDPEDTRLEADYSRFLAKEPRSQSDQFQNLRARVNWGTCLARENRVPEALLQWETVYQEASPNPAFRGPAFHAALNLCRLHTQDSLHWWGRALELSESTEDSLEATRLWDILDALWLGSPGECVKLAQFWKQPLGHASNLHLSGYEGWPRQIKQAVLNYWTSKQVFVSLNPPRPWTDFERSYLGAPARPVLPGGRRWSVRRWEHPERVYLDWGGQGRWAVLGRGRLQVGTEELVLPAVPRLWALNPQGTQGIFGFESPPSEARFDVTAGLSLSESPVSTGTSPAWVPGFGPWRPGTQPAPDGLETLSGDMRALRSGSAPESASRLWVLQAAELQFWTQSKSRWSKRSAFSWLQNRSPELLACNETADRCALAWDFLLQIYSEKGLEKEERLPCRPVSLSWEGQTLFWSDREDRLHARGSENWDQSAGHGDWIQALRAERGRLYCGDLRGAWTVRNTRGITLEAGGALPLLSVHQTQEAVYTLHPQGLRRRSPGGEETWLVLGADRIHLWRRDPEGLAFADRSGRRWVFRAERLTELSLLKNSTAVSSHGRYWGSAEGLVCGPDGPLAAFGGRPSPVTALEELPDRLIAGSAEGALWSWPLPSGPPELWGHYHKGWIQDLCTQNGQVFSAGEDGRILAWEAHEGRLVEILAKDRRPFRALLPLGRQLAAWASDPVLRVWWQPGTGAYQEWTPHGAGLSAWYADLPEERFWTAGRDGWIRAWSLPDLKPETKFLCPFAPKVIQAKGPQVWAWGDRGEWAAKASES